ncbi:MAG TPA: DDE-type integrase/transposase/recombinase [Patescibacteria group bacterium]|nr:DDE-type integrase/transposase/recombinase [Patescibacteria group bacterium]
MMTLEELEKRREERGLEIVHKERQVTRIEETFYTVLSQSGNGEYAVSQVDHEWVCECPDNKFRNVKCKHIFAVEFSKSLRKAIQRITPIENLSACIYCNSSNLMKYGLRKNKTGNLQVFYCRDCHKYFTINIGFEKMKHNPQAITSAMQLYFSGESLRNTQKSLKLLGVEVSYRTVLNWIKKYVGLMKNYVETITPNVSDTWRADEIYIKVKGDMKYLFAMMDDETRFWIAQEVAETKYTHDARKLFQMSKQLMGKKPMTIITDGLPAYHDAYKKEFWTQKKETRTEHVRHITIRGDHNNNKMERMNGEIRDREKTMRGLKTKDTAILQGYQLFHNYIRPHEGLDGKTPSEACGITIEGANKWKTLIQNATKHSQ